MIVYVSWGSNLGDSESIVAAALSKLEESPNMTVEAVSPWYRSRAVGPGEQADYINGALRLSTELDPHQLLDELQHLEASFGRERIIRWGARTLDLDILLWGDCEITDERLIVPHPRILERPFVLRPLLDVYEGETLLGHAREHIIKLSADSELTLWQHKATHSD